MEIMSDTECENWLSAFIGRPFTWEVMKTLNPFSVAYRLPGDTGKKTALARLLLASIDLRVPGLFWITSWSVFPSSENMSLFEGYRRSLGESRPLYDAAGHVFAESEAQELECLMDLALYFYWDANIFCSDSTWIEFSHDEVLVVHAKEESISRNVDERLHRFKLERI